jgi:hypothetical protein
MACLRQLPMALTFERMKLTVRSWICLWGLAGLVVPVVLLLRWHLFHHSFGELELIVWPSSFILMLGNTFDAYAVAIVMNMALYSIVGLLTSLLFSILRRHSASG